MNTSEDYDSKAVKILRKDQKVLVIAVFAFHPSEIVM
jgi:hypothetical protein